MERPAIFSTHPFGKLHDQSRGEDRLLLVHFTAEWCAPCRHMEQTTWRDEQVVTWVREHAVVGQVDIDREPETARRYSVRAVPTILALRRGEEVDRFTGARPAQGMLEWLGGVLRGETELDRVRRAAQGGDLQARLELAQVLASSDRHEEALAECLWLWQHALEKEPGWVGVRSSYLLALLEQLATTHPPAREAIARERAGAEAKNRQDWLALNKALGEVDRSLAWFDEIKSTARDDWEQLEHWLAEPLSEQERWADLAVLYPRPLERLERQHEMLDQLKPPEDAQAEMAEQLTAFAQQSFREEAATLVQALHAAGRTSEAETVAERARALDDSPEMDAFLQDAESSGQER